MVRTIKNKGFNKKKMEFKEVSPGPIALINPDSKDMKAFHFGLGFKLFALVSKDDGRWHISVSHPSRYPEWEEIKAARYELIPDDVFMVQVLGPPKNWTNVHKNCFHLWEIRDEWLIKVMKQER